MQGTPTPSSESPRTSSSVRDALTSLVATEEQALLLYAAVREALRGRGRSRREARQVVLEHGRDTPARLIPLVLAVRDELAREDPPPRGLRGRVDGLLRGMAELTASGRGPTRDHENVGPRRPPPGTPRQRGFRAGRFMRGLLSLAPDGIVTVRTSGAVGLWGGAAATMTGRRLQELGRRGLRRLFREPEEYDALIQALEKDGVAEPREVVLSGVDDADLPVRLFASRLDLPADDRRDRDRYLFFLHDLTEVHRIRSRLIETEKLSAMAKIAGSVAHEFRNPLNSLFLSTDLLEDELAGNDLEEAIAPTLTAIREEIERLNQIITHYLSLSKVASNEPEVVDLAKVVEEFAEDWRRRAEEHDLEIRVRVQDGDLDAKADPDQFRRVLVNLVENAFDALTEAAEEGQAVAKGGAVTLEVRPMRRTVKVTVRDNGPGIPESDRDLVFEPFFTSKTRGSGLGLYLVREILLAHGGAISLASTGGRGTSVAMHWPRPNGETS